MHLRFLLLRGWALLLPILWAAALPSTGQPLTDSLAQDQKKIIDAIAPYPAAVRSDILQAAAYPQALVKLERMQARTSQQFQDLVKPFPQQTRGQFYEISRYPGLVNSLVAKGKLAAGEVGQLTASYSADVQKTVSALYGPHFDVLVQMNTLYQSSQQAFNGVVQPYPAPAQQALKEVVERPEVMTLLTVHIDLTISLGEAYSANPAGVSGELDSLNGALAAQSTKDLAAFKAQVAQDPQLQAEMKKASDDFAKSYATAPGSPTTVVNNYYTTNNYAPPPYPYWFGCPYWQPAPVWYPRPLYFETGFYFGPGGHLVIVGLPSVAYSNWFFSFGRRRYPHLYNQYHTYYNIHRTNITNINVYRGFNHVVQNHFGNGQPPQHGHGPQHGNGPQPVRAFATPHQTGKEPVANGAGSPHPTKAPASFPAHADREVQAAPGPERQVTGTALRPDHPAGQPALTPLHLGNNHPRGGEGRSRGEVSGAFHDGAPHGPGSGPVHGGGFNPHALEAFHARGFHQHAWGGMGMPHGRR